MKSRRVPGPVVRGFARRSDPPLLLDEIAGGDGGLASCEEFLERLRALRAEGVGLGAVPLVFVRLDGLHEVRRRHGALIADRISSAMAHRVRAQLRQGDTVACLAAGELFILLSGDRCAATALIVAQRLEAALARPVPSVNRRHTRMANVTVEIVHGRLTGGRVQVVAGGTCLLDAPITVAGDGVARR